MFFNVSPNPGLPLKTPLAEIEFDDRSKLKILQLGDTSVIDSAPKPTTFGFSNTQGSTTSYARIDVKTKIINDKLNSLTFSSQIGDLIVEIQLTAANGTPIHSTTYLDDGHIRDQSSFHKSTTFSSADDFIHAVPNKATPEFILQLQDKTGNWLTASGPLICDQDPERRGAVAFQGWSRDQKELIFRALRKGNRPQVVKISNPYYKAMPASGPSDAMPYTHKDPDFSFTFKGVSESVIPEQGRLLIPDIDFSTRFPKADRHWGDTELEYELEACTDPTGGTHHFSHIVSKHHDHVYGIAFPAHAKQATFTYLIVKGLPYPRQRSEASIIAEGTVAEDGKSIQLDKTFTPHGIQKVKLGDIEIENGEQLCPIEFKGTWNNKKEEHDATRTLSGNINNAGIVIFTNEATTSSGYARFRSSGTSTSMSKTTFEVTKSIVGDFKPGQRLTIGLVPPLPPTRISFTVDVPSSPEQMSTDKEKK